MCMHHFMSRAITEKRTDIVRALEKKTKTAFSCVQPQSVTAEILSKIISAEAQSGSLHSVLSLSVVSFKQMHNGLTYHKLI